MRLPEPLLARLAPARRVLMVVALASVTALGTAACDEVLPDMETEQGEDGQEEEEQDQDEDGEDGQGDEDEGDED